jgi:hypothetical protein
MLVWADTSLSSEPGPPDELYEQPVDLYMMVAEAESYEARWILMNPGGLPEGIVVGIAMDRVARSLQAVRLAIDEQVDWSVKYILTHLREGLIQIQRNLEAALSIMTPGRIIRGTPAVRMPADIIRLSEPGLMVKELTEWETFGIRSVLKV